MPTRAYSEAFDALTAYALPRRKYAPQHWLTEWYFFGRGVGYQVWHILHRHPFVVLWHGIRDGYTEG